MATHRAKPRPPLVTPIGYRLFVPFVEDSGPPWDYAGGVRPTLGAVVPGKDTGPWGRQRTIGLNSTISYPGRGYAALPPALTICAVLRVDGTSGTYGGHVLATDSSDSGIALSITAALGLQYVRSSIGADSSGITLTAGRTYALGLVRLETGAGNIRFYSYCYNDGSYAKSTISNTGAAGAGNSVAVVNTALYSQYINGSMSLIGLAPTAWDDAAFARFAADPFRPLRPRGIATLLVSQSGGATVQVSGIAASRSSAAAAPGSSRGVLGSSRSASPVSPAAARSTAAAGRSDGASKTAAAPGRAVAPGPLGASSGRSGATAVTAATRGATASSFGAVQVSAAPARAAGSAGSVAARSAAAGVPSRAAGVTGRSDGRSSARGTPGAAAVLTLLIGGVSAGVSRVIGIAARAAGIAGRSAAMTASAAAPVASRKVAAESAGRAGATARASALRTVRGVAAAVGRAWARLTTGAVAPPEEPTLPPDLLAAVLARFDAGALAGLFGQVLPSAPKRWKGEAAAGTSLPYVVIGSDPPGDPEPVQGDEDAWVQVHRLHLQVWAGTDAEAGQLARAVRRLFASRGGTAPLVWEGGRESARFPAPGEADVLAKERGPRCEWVFGRRVTIEFRATYSGG